MYRRQIIFNHVEVFNSDQLDFPVLVSLRDPALSSLDVGDHGAQPDGRGIFFTLPGQGSRLAHQLVAFDPRTGELEAWVRLPRLASRADTTIELHSACPPAPPIAQSPESVWETSFVLVASGDAAPVQPAAGDLRLADQLTLEAWVCGAGYRPEALQPLVSQWAPLGTFDTFSAHDAGHTDGLKCIAYFGAVFDGRYVYFSPQHYQDRTAHGNVLRYDTHGDFHASASFAAYDAGQTDGLATRGFYGAAFDGRFVYFVPRQDETGYHSRVLRYDTHGDFRAAGSWAAYDVGEAHSQQGVAFDGRYLYFSPGFQGDPRKEDQYSARVIRFDTQADFKDPASWRVFDAAGLHGLRPGCFDGAGFDGRYIYFAPLIHRTVLRYDTRGDFAAAESWQVHDAERLGLTECVGVIFDGTYVYFVPYRNDVVVRFDTRGVFDDPDAWSAFAVGNVSGLSTGGSDGGFFDGRYVYFVPFVNRREGQPPYQVHTNFLRYDTAGAFDDPASWSAHDASRTDDLKTMGYNAGAFDGRFFYLAPWQDATPPEPMHGRVLRYDTLGAGGAFSLRYCDYGHNGGLCAAVLGPSFLVNTTQGVRSVAAHRALSPGWHYLAGTYTGQSLKLFVDGQLVAERTAGGPIQACALPVMIGRFPAGVACFSGQIELIRISRVARSDDWIKTAYRNLRSPTTFAQLGPIVEAG